MSSSYTTSPSEEHRLREACSNGDKKTVLKLLTPQEGCFTSPVGKWTQKQFRCEQRIPSLEYVYMDDCENRVVHYLCGAKCPSSRFDMLFTWFSNIFDTRGDPTTHDVERADILKELLQRGFQLDLSPINTKKFGVLHYCVQSNSVEVLRVIIQHMSSGSLPSDKHPNLQAWNPSRKTPLMVALDFKRFECAKLLISVGALKGLLRPIQNRYNQHITHLFNVEPSTPSGYSSFVSNMSDPLKRTEKKVKSLEAELQTKLDSNEEPATQKVLKGESEIQTSLLDSISSLMKDFATDESTAYTMLSTAHFDMDLAKEISVDWPDAGNQQICIVCYDTICEPPIKMPCHHPTCNDCWRGVLRARLNEGDVHETKCPHPDCGCRFPLNRINDILDADQADQFMRLLGSRYIDGCSTTKWCPRQSCGAAVMLEGADPGDRRVAECICGFSFCWKCMQPDHEPATCKQAEDWRSVLDVVQAERESSQWVKKETVPCPGCKSPIERDGGCNHMKCSVCRQEFCYQCGQRWKGHADHYTCFASRESVQKRIDDAIRRWKIVEKALNKLKRTSDLAWYEHHLRQYWTHDLDEQRLKSVGNYMSNILRMTLPGNHKAAGSEGAEPNLNFIQEWIKVLINSKRTLKNSFIVSFSLKKGSARRKFLDQLQGELEEISGKLLCNFTLFPDFTEISKETKISDDVNQFTTDESVFYDQFLYCHALHERRTAVQEICDTTSRLREKMLRAGELGLVFHKKHHSAKIPHVATRPSTDK